MNNRIIDVREMEKECSAENCPNYWLRLNWIRSNCRNCIYDALKTKIEIENNRRSKEVERDVCEICKRWWPTDCTNCIYGKK